MTKESEYKGHPILEIYQEGSEKWPLRIGYRKAVMILENVKDLEAFVSKHRDTQADKADRREAELLLGRIEKAAAKSGVSLETALELYLKQGNGKVPVKA